MKQPNGLSFAGEYTFEYCVLSQAGGNSVDIKNQVDGVVLYEDLYSPFISGTIFLKDSVDIPNLLGRPGATFVSLKIYTPSIDKRFIIQGNFHVYKHSNRVETGDRVQKYELHFISEESFLDEQTQISKFYSGDPHSIVKRIMRDAYGTEKALEYEESSTSLQYVSNFWTPSKNFRYICENSYNKNNNPSYMFFENRDGFNFLTMDHLSRKTSIQDFSKSNFMAEKRSDANPTSLVRNMDMDFKSILQINVDVVYDYLRDKESGMIKSLLITHDLVTKKYKTNLYGLSSLDSKLNPRSLYSPSLVTDLSPKLMHAIKGYGTFSTRDQTNLNYVQKRLTQIAAFESSKIEIEVFGRTDYTVGRKVNINLNQMREILEAENSDAYLDKTLSGNYIISSIAHRFKNDGHVCTMELVKESTLLS